MVCTAARVQFCSLWFVGIVFNVPHRKKSQGVRSGDLGGQSRRCSNLFERPCIKKGCFNKDLRTSSLISQVPVEGHNVTHVTDTTHTTYACSNFQRVRSTNDVTLCRDKCTLPPVSLLQAEGCWEMIHVWHATSLLTDVNSVSLHGRGIFVKVHTRVVTHIRYIWYTFHCDRPKITGTLHEH